MTSVFDTTDAFMEAAATPTGDGNDTQCARRSIGDDYDILKLCAFLSSVLILNNKQRFRRKNRNRKLCNKCRVQKYRNHSALPPHIDRHISALKNTLFMKEYNPISNAETDVVRKMDYRQIAHYISTFSNFVKDPNQILKLLKWLLNPQIYNQIFAKYEVPNSSEIKF